MYCHSEIRGQVPVWTDRVIVSDGASEFDRVDKLVPLESGWDGQNVFAIRITMVKHLQCTDVARCGGSNRAKKKTPAGRQIYGIREVEVIGYDASARRNFAVSSPTMRILTFFTTALILLRP